MRHRRKDQEPSDELLDATTTRSCSAPSRVPTRQSVGSTGPLRVFHRYVRIEHDLLLDAEDVRRALETSLPDLFWLPVSSHRVLASCQGQETGADKPNNVAKIGLPAKCGPLSLDPPHGFVSGERPRNKRCGVLVVVHELSRQDLVPCERFANHRQRSLPCLVWRERGQVFLYLPEHCPKTDGIGLSLFHQDALYLFHRRTLDHGMNFTSRIPMPGMRRSIVAAGRARLPVPVWASVGGLPASSVR